MQPVPRSSWADALPSALRRPLALGLTGARSGVFLAESLPLLALQNAIAGTSVGSSPPAGLQEALLRELRSLVERDATNIAEGLYPLSVLAMDAPLGHAFRYAWLLADSIGVAFRRRGKKPREFAGPAEDLLDEVPEYYRRNFHFQTDGYLSESSAELYEHQVEILFRGLGDAMRRLIVPPFAEHFGRDGGRGLHFLELGAGCGTATRFVAQVFPEARITALDLSPPYLKKARVRLAEFDRLGFVEGDAAELDFREQCFDGVFSVFMFHELPLAERRRVLSEARRVLKPGGLLGIVDSLQLGDVPELDWTLDQFPRQFHEPYYRNYARQPLEELLEEAGFDPARMSVDTGFVSKRVAVGT